MRVGRTGGELDLGDLPRDEAVRINERCQAADGIEHIDADGTVTFTEPEMAIMRRLLGYECKTMQLADSAAHADELAAKYRAFAESHA